MQPKDFLMLKTKIAELLRKNNMLAELDSWLEWNGSETMCGTKRMKYQNLKKTY